jgi:predicted ATPase
MARIDRLATVKTMAQLGATLGREFSYALLQAVSPWDEGTLLQGLQQLVAAEFLYQQGLPPQATYLFKHALIQDTAYQSLLRSTRQQYHQRIAQVLEARFPETCETQPELLAHHYTEAGLGAQAMPYWQQAGQRALQRSANVEAIEHLTRGLDILKTLSDTPERAQRELDLQVALGPALMATKGLAATEVEHAYARARELCHQVGETPQLFPVLMGLCMLYRQRGAFQTARQVGEQCLALAQHADEPALLLEAHCALGVPLFYLGELALSRFHLEQGSALYDLQRDRSHAFRYGLDAGVNSLLVAWPVWLLGYPDQALERSREALILAQELSHPYSLAYALQSAMRLHRFRREVWAAREQADALVTLANQQGFAQWVAGGTMLCGWALTVQGRAEEGIEQMHQGLTAWRAMRIEAGLPYWLAMLAEAYGSTGQVEAGRRVLAEACALVDTTEERWWAAELHRLKGELLLALSMDNTAEAETCLHQALEIARRQQAKSLELRAAMSLACLWQRQGKRDEARELLAPIYGWFTEGLDTADLQEAKALLDEWS